MTAAPESLDALRQVREYLAGPIMDVLAGLMPEIAAIPPAERYNAVLNDVDVLERCFIAFRHHRERFLPLLLDAGGNIVETDEVPMRCGRSITQVIGLVVRAAAKRHIQRTTATGALAPYAQDKRDQAARRDHYMALADHLLHEWQAPLVPAYAGLPTAFVRNMGERILAFPDKESLVAAAKAPIKLVPRPKAKAPADTFEEPVPTQRSGGGPTVQTRSTKDEIMFRLVEGRRVRIDELETIVVTAIEQGVIERNLNRLPHDMSGAQMMYLINGLSRIDTHLDVRKVAIAVAAIYGALDLTGFKKIFGLNAGDADIAFGRKLIDAILTRIGRSVSPATIIGAVSDVLRKKDGKAA